MASNQTAWSYDPSGDIVVDTQGQQYLYDAEGRICAMQSGTVDGIAIWTGYVYDAEGRRVAKGSINPPSPSANPTCDPSTNGFSASVNETDYVLDQDGHQVTEMASQGSGTMQWAHTNVWAGGQLVGTYAAITDANGQQDGALHFYLSDWLGSRRVQTDYAGVWEQDCSSLPYGDQLNCTQSIQQPTEHHFTGKERDAKNPVMTTSAPGTTGRGWGAVCRPILVACWRRIQQTRRVGICTLMRGTIRSSTLTRAGWIAFTRTILVQD